MIITYSGCRKRIVLQLYLSVFCEGRITFLYYIDRIVWFFTYHTSQSCSKGRLRTHEIDREWCLQIAIYNRARHTKHPMAMMRAFERLCVAASYFRRRFPVICVPPGSPPDIEHIRPFNSAAFCLFKQEEAVSSAGERLSTVANLCEAGGRIHSGVRPFAVGENARRFSIWAASVHRSQSLRHLLISNIPPRPSGTVATVSWAIATFIANTGTILASNRKGHSKEQFQERVGGCALQPFVYFSGPPYKVTRLGAKKCRPVRPPLVYRNPRSISKLLNLNLAP